MSGWQKKIAPLLRWVEKRYDSFKYRLYYRLWGPGPIQITPYRGYGTRRKLYLKGRVLEERGITRARATDSLWDNLVNMIKRVDSREVPHARLLARCQQVERGVVTDEEGMFELQLDLPNPLSSQQTRQSVELELLEPLSDRQTGPVRATGQVMLPPPGARLGVISDVDDTVLVKSPGGLIQMARELFFGSARTRLPFPGVAAFYRALRAGPEGEAGNPLFYVSNSPWNLYDLLIEFFELHRIPLGPLFLRNWGIYQDELLPTQQRKHKLPLIRQVLDFYPQLPFILIGDSGEADPEIYHEIVGQYPGRVLAVYIRNVSRNLERPAAIQKLAQEVLAAGSTLILAQDSLTMARHAAGQGWISFQALSAIEAEKRRDESPAGPLETLLAQEPPAKGPTLHVGEDDPDEAIQSALKTSQGTPTVVVRDQSQSGKED